MRTALHNSKKRAGGSVTLKWIIFKTGRLMGSTGIILIIIKVISTGHIRSLFH